MNSLPFGQLKSFLKILIGVQYNTCAKYNKFHNEYGWEFGGLRKWTGLRFDFPKSEGKMLRRNGKCVFQKS